MKDNTIAKLKEKFEKYGIIGENNPNGVNYLDLVILFKEIERLNRFEQHFLNSLLFKKHEGDD